MLDGLASLSVTVQDLALITHAVPAGRVRPHLPSPYELETFPERGGQEMCFVSATCFCNHNFRWSALPCPRHTFNESTYRTYVKHKGGQGVYFLGRYLGTPLATTAQRTLARDTFLGNFEVGTERSEAGYTSYGCRISSERGNTSFRFEAGDAPAARPPFASGYELSQFLTYRLEGYFTSTLGAEGHMPVRHRRMDPYEGNNLVEGRFDLWDELGIVPAEEAGDPFSILVVPEVHFKLQPPRPLL